MMLVGSLCAAFCVFSSQVPVECVLQGSEAKLLRNEVLTGSGLAWFGKANGLIGFRMFYC